MCAMRARTLAAGFGLFLGTGPVLAQPPQLPPLPIASGPLPGSTLPGVSSPLPGSTLPITPIGQSSPIQPGMPSTNQSPNTFPALPTSGYPGYIPASLPQTPQNPITQPPNVFQQGIPSLLTNRPASASMH